MANEIRIEEEELHAFIDGELEPARASAIEKAAAADAMLAARIRAFRADKERLAAIYAGLRERPLPDAWLVPLRDRAARRRPPVLGWPLSRRLVGAIAAGVLVILGLGLVYQLRPLLGDSILAEAIAARENALRPDETIAAAVLTNPEARDRVLAQALAMMLKVPDLSRMGYQVADLRLYSGVPGGRAAELVYRDAQNRLFTVYVRRPSGPARIDLLQRDGMRICIWQDEVVGMVMLGETISAGEMARLASLTYSGLTL